MRHRDTVESSSLRRVLAELDATLIEIQNALEAYAENPDHPERLQPALKHLQRTRGTLELVGLYGPCVLADEMRRVIRVLAANEGESGDTRRLESLIAATLRLSDYLQHVRAGSIDMPVVLLPEINELRAFREARPVDSTYVFHPDLSLVPEPLRKKAPLPGTELRTIRAKINRALVLWFRGAQPTPFRAASQLSARLARHATTDRLIQLWTLVAAVFEGLAESGLDAGSMAVRKIVGRAANILQAQITSGDDAASRVVTPELLRSFLLEVGGARSTGPIVTGVKSFWHLYALLPDPALEKRARAVLEGPNMTLLESVAGTVKEELTRVKDALEIYVHGQEKNRELLQPLAAMPGDVLATLKVLEIDSAHQLLASQVPEIEQVLASEGEVDPERLMHLASMLLDIDSRLDDYIAEHAALTADRAAPTPVEIGIRRLPEGEFNEILSQVTGECLINVANIRDDLLAYIETPDQLEPGQLERTLVMVHEIYGAAAALPLSDVAPITLHLEHYVRRRYLERGVRPDRREQLLVADVIASIEYYLEAMQQDQSDLVNVIRHGILAMRALEAEFPPDPPSPRPDRPTRESRDTALDAAPAVSEMTKIGTETMETPAVQIDDEVAFSETELLEEAAELGGALTPDADMRGWLDDGDLLPAEKLAAEQTAEAAEAERESGQVIDFANARNERQTGGPAPPGVDDGELAVVGDDVDEEILEVFIEEADDELERINEFLPRWKKNAGDQEAVATIRRSFHTLKGSGRLIGALLIGEYAWSIEHLLNRVMDKSVPVSRATFDLLDEAAALLPQLIEQLKGGPAPAASVGDLIARCQHLATTGQPLERTPASAEARLAASAPAPGEPDQPEAIEPEAIEPEAIEIEAIDAAFAESEPSFADTWVMPESEQSPEPEPGEPDLAEAAIAPVAPEAEQAFEDTWVMPGGEEVAADSVDTDSVETDSEPAPGIEFEESDSAAEVPEVDTGSDQAFADTWVMAEDEKPGSAATVVDDDDEVWSRPPAAAGGETAAVDDAGRISADELSQWLDDAPIGSDDQPGDEFDWPGGDSAVAAEQPEPEPIGTDLDGYDEISFADTIVEPFADYDDDLPPLTPEPETAPEFTAEPADEAEVEPDEDEEVDETAYADVELTEEQNTRLLSSFHMEDPDPWSPLDEPEVEDRAEQVAASAAGSEPVDSPALDLGATAIDPVLLEIFSNESRVHLDSMSRLLDAARQSGQNPAIDDDLIRALHTLHGSAQTADVQPIAQLSGALEKLCKLKRELGQPLRDGETKLLHEGLEAMDAALAWLADPKNEPPAVDRISERAQVALARVEEAAQPATAFDGQDAELLSIFIEEGEEILDTSDRLLEKWQQNPGDRHLVDEFKRQLHTLKGGARMAGFTPLADISHATESLLGNQEEILREGNAQGLFELLHEAIDALTVMMEQARNGRVIGSVEWLKKELEDPRFDSSGESAQTVEAREPAEAEILPEGDGEAAEAPAREPAPAAVVEAQDVVRVRADLIDNLVNYAGEVNIYHSRLGQTLGDYRFNLSELEQTVFRLRDQLRKMDIETEAQILNRYEREAVEAGEGSEDFDPLEFDRYTRIQELSRALMESVSDLESIKGILSELTRDSETLLLQQSRVSTDLQDGLMRTRMVRFDRLAARFGRIVRQTAGAVGRKAELVIVGGDTEIDRSVQDHIVAPIEHMLRNAVSHGIEPPDQRAAAGKPVVGVIELKLARDGGDVVIVLSDDGGGIDVDAVRSKANRQGLLDPERHMTDRDLMQLVLENGLSTASTISQISGRGVGLGVVEKEIKQLGGNIEIESTRGTGTRFVIRLPLTLAINQALLVSAAGESFAIPLASIEGVTQVTQEQLQEYYTDRHKLHQYAGAHYEVHHLGSLLGVGNPRFDDAYSYAPLVLIRSGDFRVAIHAEALLGRREIVVKPVGAQVSTVKGVSGATILADGQVVLILDIGALLRTGGVVSTEMVTAEETTVASIAPVIMVVDDSITIRKVTARMLERNQMKVLTAKDGMDALAVLTEQRPDLILLDIEMPRMDGYEVAAYVRNNDHLHDVPIIMITSRTGRKHRERAEELGVNRYLGKPYLESELLDNINDVLGEAQG